MSSPNAVQAAGWGVFLVGTGVITGTLVDVLAGRLLRSQIQHPVVRGLVQVALGVVVLGQVMSSVLTEPTSSPLGDTPMLIFFYLSQPSLHADVGAIGAYLRGVLNKVTTPAASLTPAASVVPPPPPVASVPSMGPGVGCATGGCAAAVPASKSHFKSSRF